MIVRLPFHNIAATSRAMRGMLTSLMLVFAILVGNVIMPTIAHAQAAQVGHSAEALDGHEHDVSSDEDSQKPDGEKPCHAIAHHHCSAALRAELPAIAMTPVSPRLKAIPLSLAKLASFSQAPPTEPPAA